ncbi:MAG: sigma-70 family RNA polymerase sigma factor [Firmicutes bacterium]|nr:sigma-70 family RNA polymerase sigma factor [Bacillota bacterium]
MGEQSTTNGRAKGAGNLDDQTLAALLQANYHYVLGYFIKLTQDPNLARDLTQETMVKAIKNCSQYRHEASFASWLISIGVNLYRDNWCRQKRLEKRYQTLFESNNQSTETVPVNTIILKQALLKLPLKKRTPLVLKYYYNFSYQEIAAILKIPVGTVRSRLHAAVRALRDSLANREE